jgi:alkylhydroperoxidase family enzyme
LGDAWTSKDALPQWVRLLANFSGQGKNRILSEKTAVEKGDLTPLIKAQVSWIIARQDRAWYAAGEARKRLKALGQTDDQIFALDGDWSKFTSAEQAMFTLARKLASSPVVLTDAEVENTLKLTGPKEVVQLISYTTNRASFDRITEAAGLAIEN